MDEVSAVYLAKAIENRADYTTDAIAQLEASRGFRRCREFVEAVQKGAGDVPCLKSTTRRSLRG